MSTEAPAPAPTTTPAAETPPDQSSAPASSPPKAPAQPKNPRAYPKSVTVDFRKLSPANLNRYIEFHGIQVRAEATAAEMAAAVARHFESLKVDGGQVICGLLERMEAGGRNVPSQYARETAFYDGLAMPQPIRKRHRIQRAAKAGEQVAAKVTRTDENGSWILAKIVRFYPDTETYDVQDEDDTSKLIRLPWNHVMRLQEDTRRLDNFKMSTVFKKGERVLGIFPETTSFYRATVSKEPDRSYFDSPREVVVKFEDDEDAHGRTPHRKVPHPYLIPEPSSYFYDEEDDVDLTTPVTRT